MAGGFARWAADGLPVDAKRAGYEASLLNLVEDEAEVLGAAATSALAPLKQPGNAAAAVAGLVALAYAASNYHAALQFIGIFGALTTAALRVSTYDSAEDALADLTSTYASLSSLLPATPSTASSMEEEEAAARGEAPRRESP